MTTPTLFQTKGALTFNAKVEPQNVIAQQATAALTTAMTSGTIIGMFRVQKGFQPTFISVSNGALGGTVTLDIGYAYDNNTTSGADAPTALVTANAAATAGSFAWPTSASSTAASIGVAVAAAGDGYVIIRTGGSTVGTNGNVNIVLQGTYNL